MGENQALKASSPMRQYLRDKTWLSELLDKVAGKQPLFDMARGESDLGTSF